MDNAQHEDKACRHTDELGDITWQGTGWDIVGPGI
jgi:hypothetical protein